MKQPFGLLFITALVFAVAACVTQPKLQYYEFPSDITDEARTGNLKNIEKGRVLYNLNCAKCHNKNEK
jgi:mono/diheme cytochrome c family protein